MGSDAPETDVERPAKWPWLWVAVPIVVLCGPVVLMFLVPCIGPLVYTTGGSAIRVVDRDTRAGVPGAVVVMSWELTGFYGSRVGWVEVQEATTDPNGVAHFEGWHRLRWPPFGILSGGQPWLTVVARGYVPNSVPDRQSRKGRFTTGWTSSWAAGVEPIELRPETNTPTRDDAWAESFAESGLQRMSPRPSEALRLLATKPPR